MTCELCDAYRKQLEDERAQNKTLALMLRQKWAEYRQLQETCDSLTLAVQNAVQAELEARADLTALEACLSAKTDLRASRCAECSGKRIVQRGPTAWRVCPACE